jgi:hypothetical protein
MRTWLASAWSLSRRIIKFGAAAAALSLFTAASALAQEAGGEAGLKLPDLSQVSFLGIDGHKLLLFGIVICIFGLAFGLAMSTNPCSTSPSSSTKPARPISLRRANS